MTNKKLEFDKTEHILIKTVLISFVMTMVGFIYSMFQMPKEFRHGTLTKINLFIGEYNQKLEDTNAEIDWIKKRVYLKEEIDLKNELDSIMLHSLLRMCNEGVHEKPKVK